MKILAAQRMMAAKYSRTDFVNFSNRSFRDDVEKQKAFMALPDESKQEVLKLYHDGHSAKDAYDKIASK